MVKENAGRWCHPCVLRRRREEAMIISFGIFSDEYRVQHRSGWTRSRRRRDRRIPFWIMRPVRRNHRQIVRWSMRKNVVLIAWHNSWSSSSSSPCLVRRERVLLLLLSRWKGCLARVRVTRTKQNRMRRKEYCRRCFFRVWICKEGWTSSKFVWNHA